jgi:ribose transport system ATP-binding protein
MASPDLLNMVDVTKTFGGVKALANVDFTLKLGQVHALLGKNGAGKSTLVKILMGVHTPDSGEIYINGSRVMIPNAHAAQQLGIAIVYQELSLVPDLSVSENIFLGRLPTVGKSSWVDWTRLEEMTRQELKKLDSDIDPKARVGDLRIAEQQIVEIAKALSFNPKILILDEPTSALTDREVNDLFDIIRVLQATKNVGIIYISHRLAEIEQIADRFTILRDGKKITEGRMADVDKKDIVQHIVGESLTSESTRIASSSDEVLMSVKRLSREKAFTDISFDLHKGEILGIAGLVGSKRTELLRAIYGADSYDDGQIILDGEEIGAWHSRQAKSKGLAFVPEDRKGQGLIGDLSVKENLTITVLDKISNNRVLDTEKENRIASWQVKQTNVKTFGIDASINSLSGGNQQKVVLGKWLATEPKVLLLDEPTRGVDVGAKAEIFTLLEDLASKGAGIVFVSSELEEVLAVSDRVLVMYDGRIVDEFSSERPWTLEDVMLAASGN